MKNHPSDNKLCLSCRRFCKQPEAAVIALCPRYYPKPKIKKYQWRQMELNL